MRLRLALLIGATCFLSIPALADTSDDAVAALKRGDFQNALELFLASAGLGDAAAQNHLGTMYQRGQGVPQDNAEAATAVTVVLAWRTIRIYVSSWGPTMA